MSKQSRYNHFQPWRDGYYIAYNALSGAVALMTAENYATYQDMVGKFSEGGSPTWTDKQRELLDQLKYGHFVCEDETDELETLKFSHNMSRYNQSQLGLTIAPTLACNMACEYCYEGNKTGRMSSAIIESIVAHVEKNGPQISRLETCWYGGEPLLALDIMEDLTESFLDLGKEHKFDYKSSAISNGYLLTPEVADKLRDMKVMTVQVTLDGPERVHNRKRPLKNGRGSFKTIVENIGYASSVMGVGVRVNVDKSFDAAMIEELLGELAEAGLQQRIGLYFGLVEPATQVCSNISEYCYQGPDFSLVEVDYFRLLLKHGFRIERLPSPLGTFCFAQALNSFVVDPSGNLYRCLHYVGDPTKSMGMISGEPNYEHPNFTRLFRFDPFSDSLCSGCNLMPICLGGCPSRRMDRGVTGTDQCESWKHNLTSMLDIIAASRQQQARAQTQDKATVKE